MSEAEKEVLKTFKSGLGLTGAEREILVNYIEKLQKVIDLMINYIDEHDFEDMCEECLTGGNFCVASKVKEVQECIKEYFYKKAEDKK